MMRAQVKPFLLGEKMSNRYPSVMDRILCKIEKTDSCWIWNGAKTGGDNSYGTIWKNGKRVLVHRIMYESVNGKIPNHLEIDHLCRNKRCVNPKHLEAVTHRENMLRADVGKHLKDRTHCPKGHEYTPENTRITHGSRSCRACESLYNKRRWAKHKAELSAKATA